MIKDEAEIYSSIFSNFSKLFQLLGTAKLKAEQPSVLFSSRNIKNIV